MRKSGILEPSKKRAKQSKVNIRCMGKTIKKDGLNSVDKRMDRQQSILKDKSQLRTTWSSLKWSQWS